MHLPVFQSLIRCRSTYILYQYIVACDASAYDWLQIHTSAMGDIHHFAWRARHSHETVYINKRDGERFGNWSIHECMVSALHDCCVLQNKLQLPQLEIVLLH